jgi:hypothetical protein
LKGVPETPEESVDEEVEGVNTSENEVSAETYDDRKLIVDENADWFNACKGLGVAAAGLAPVEGTSSPSKRPII